jgi:hypothetical protein
MPTTYHCDNCDVTAASLVGWILVSVQFLHDDQTSTTGHPYSRTCDYIAPDLLFHDVACRDAWCAKAGISVPVQG